jgi:hypothetical protein
MGGWKDMLTATYTGTTSLYLFIFVGLVMNQDETIFVPIFRKKNCFITNIVQLTVLIVIILLIKYSSFTICIAVPHRIY